MRILGDGELKPLLVFISFSMHPVEVQWDIAKVIQAYHKWDEDKLEGEVKILHYPKSPPVGGGYHFEHPTALVEAVKTLCSPPDSLLALRGAIDALPNGGCICGIGIFLKGSGVSWKISKEA